MEMTPIAFTPVNDAQFVRALYPHNQAAFDAMIDAIAKNTRLSVSMPNNTGFKFAVLEMLHAMPHFKFLYLTPTVFGSWQITSQALKTDLDISNAQFMTYEELAALPAKRMKELMTEIQVLVLAEYMSISTEQEQKLTKLLSYLGEDATVLGKTSLRPFHIDAYEKLRKRYDTIMGKDCPMEEFFDLRGACQYGNFDYPIYAYCNLGQAKQIAAFCDRVKAADGEGRYTKYINRAKYTAVDKDVMLAFAASQLPSQTEGKYVVLCEKKNKFDKEAALVRDLFPTLKDKSLYTYDGTKAMEADLDQFLFQDETEGLHVLLTHYSNILDVKIADATACIIMYRITRPWEFYLALNAALASCRIRYKMPVILDLFNNNYSITYITPDIEPTLPRLYLNCIYAELGVTRSERMLYTKEERVHLPYREAPQDSALAFNLVVDKFIARRIENNDLSYMRELLDTRTEVTGLPLSPEHPYGADGVNILRWGKLLLHDQFENFTPLDYPEDGKEYIRDILKGFNYKRKKKRVPAAQVEELVPAAAK